VGSEGRRLEREALASLLALLLVFGVGGWLRLVAWWREAAALAAAEGLVARELGGGWECIDGHAFGGGYHFVFQPVGGGTGCCLAVVEVEVEPSAPWLPPFSARALLLHLERCP
jgi:hypothetical protein